MVRFSAGLMCVALSAAAWVGPVAAQTTLTPATAVAPGSPEASFGPTAYAKPDREFQLSVREIDAVQLSLAKTAEQKASPAVGAFAKQVRLAFSGGEASLRGMSDNNGVPIVGTAKVLREHETLVAQMQADNADVDRLFVDYEVLVLEEALGLVQAYAAGGTDPRWREAAAKAVSEDQTLLGTARSLQKP